MMPNDPTLSFESAASTRCVSPLPHPLPALNKPAHAFALIMLAFAISWIAYWVPLGERTGLRLWLVKFGPSLAGLFLVLVVMGWRSGLRALLQSFRPRVGLVGYLSALLLPGLLVAVALMISASWVPLPPGEWQLVSLVALASWLAVRFFAGGGLGEELGWRGVLTPILVQRLGVLKGCALLGLVSAFFKLVVASS